MDDNDDLREAFESVYLDLCSHGVTRFDPQILAELWTEFLLDAAAGFPSLFKTARPQ